MSFLNCTASTIPAICGGSMELCRGCTIYVLGADKRHHIRIGRKCCLPLLRASMGHRDEDCWSGRGRRSREDARTVHLNRRAAALAIGVAYTMIE